MLSALTYEDSRDLMEDVYRLLGGSLLFALLHGVMMVYSSLGYESGCYASMARQQQLVS